MGRAAIPLALVGLWLAYTAWCVFGLAGDEWWPEWDSSLYLLTARSLAEGNGYTYLDQPFFLRPPGLSWLLSWLVGGTPPDFDALALNRLIAFSAAASVGAVYLAVRRSHGRLVALSVAALFASSALFAARLNHVESDFPFTAFLYLGLALAPKSNDPPARGMVAAVVAGASLAASVYMRSAGLAALAGLATLALFQRTRAERLRSAVVVVTLCVLVSPWLLHARSAAAVVESPSEQLLLFDYTTAMLRVDPGDPTSAWVSLGAWGERLVSNATALARELARQLTGVGDPRLGAALTLLLGVGLAADLRKRIGVLPGFALGYAGLLLVYFVYNPRLVLPLAPVAYLYGLLGAAVVGGFFAERLSRHTALRHAPIVGALALALLITNVVRWPDRTLRGRWAMVHEIGRLIREHTPPDSVWMADNAPVISVVANRRVYTFRHPRRQDLLAHYRPDYVLLNLEVPTARAFESQLLADSERRWMLAPSMTRPGVRVYQAVEDP